LPSSTKNDNINRSVIKISLKEDLASFDINREQSLFGHYKEGEQSDKLYFFDYVYEDYKKYGNTPLMELVKNKELSTQKNSMP
jgi:hypothetical protein